ncbi:MAG: hypothetical protein NTX00_04325 [Candidatus Parcubacteria bacterium]|nr:hypothetical protein [Candidatus Parcubacteria bacterium]
MDKSNKLFVRIQMAGPAILEHLFNFVGFARLGTHFKHGQTLVQYAWEYHEKWIYLRLTAKELGQIDLSQPGTLFCEKLNLYLPYWAICKVEISSSNASTHPANRHWALWSQFPGWGNCEYLNEKKAA